MKGLELSEKFYLEFGAPMIHEAFPTIEGLIAVGLAGSGSECFGYDDVISEDHDFEPGFCLFIPDEDVIDRKTEFALERAYSRLPKEFMGYRRSPLSPVGGNRHGVIRMSDFFRSKVGNPKGELNINDWFFLPEQSVAEAVNGKVFRDDLGLFSDIRASLAYMPEDVKLKRLAGELLTMGQAGQYNYGRCVLRREYGAAQMAVFEFVKSTIHVVFLLNNTYMPYYKWSFRALRALPILSSLCSDLEYLISSGNENEDSIRKQKLIDAICLEVISELSTQNLTDFSGSEIEGHAYSVNDKIINADIRNLHILYAV